MTSLFNRCARPPRLLPSQSAPTGHHLRPASHIWNCRAATDPPLSRQERDHRLLKTANTLMASSLSTICAAPGWWATLPPTVVRREPRGCRQARRVGGRAESPAEAWSSLRPVCQLCDVGHAMDPLHLSFLDHRGPVPLPDF